MDIGVADKSKGITDQQLVQYFDTISRYRGNNIVSNSFSCKMNWKFISTLQTFLLDCLSSQFKWGKPSSFVVIAPRAVPPENRKVFTESIICVLRSEKDSLGFLTVQSFAAKVQSNMCVSCELYLIIHG